MPADEYSGAVMLGIPGVHLVVASSPAVRRRLAVPRLYPFATTFPIFCASIQIPIPVDISHRSLQGQQR